MKYKEDYLLSLLLDELVKDTGMNFYNENGENDSFDVINEILENETSRDAFYEVLTEILSQKLDNYIEERAINKEQTKDNSKIVKLYK